MQSGTRRPDPDEWCLLGSADEVYDLDLLDLLEDDAVVVIEWGEQVLEALPGDYLRLRLRLARPDEPDEARVVELDFVGPRWAERQDAVRADLADLEETP